MGLVDKPRATRRMNTVVREIQEVRTGYVKFGVDWDCRIEHRRPLDLE